MSKSPSNYPTATNSYGQNNYSYRHSVENLPIRVIILAIPNYFLQWIIRMCFGSFVTIQSAIFHIAFISLSSLCLRRVINYNEQRPNGHATSWSQLPSSSQPEPFIKIGNIKEIALIFFKFHQSFNRGCLILQQIHTEKFCFIHSLYFRFMFIYF